MRIKLKDLELKLYIGDLSWEKKRLQRVSVTLAIDVKKNPPDYWRISQAIVGQFSKERYAWLEDLALAMAKFLKTKFKIRGSLTLQKFPRVPKSPRVFEVQISL